MNHEPKGTISKSDIDILLAFGSRMETICARLGYDYLSRQAQTVKRIAIMASYEANYEARRRRVQFPHDGEEYPYSIDSEEPEPVSRFMARMTDEDMPCER